MYQVLKFFLVHNKKANKTFFARFARKKGGEVVQILGTARNLNHFPPFSHERSECEKVFAFFLMYLEKWGNLLRGG